MKNLFEKEAVDEVISRIDKLQPATQRQWGKMDVAQMMAHCSGALDMASGKSNLPRVFVDEVISRIDKLQPATQRQWGKMDVAQMMAHCSGALDMASGKSNLPRVF